MKTISPAGVSTAKTRSKLSAILLLLLLSFFSLNTNAQLVGNENVNAKFGIDGDFYSNRLENGTFSVPASGTDDWFQDGLPGLGVIDTQGAGAIRAYLSAPGRTEAEMNFTFEKRMSAPIGSVNNGTRWIDAVFGRDNLGGSDSSVFTGSNKNFQNPKTAWQMGLGSSPDKNDIVDAFAHIRRDGLDPLLSPLWAYAGATVLSPNGAAHADFEYFRNTITYEVNPGTGVGAFIGNSGDDEGHTAWQFDAITGDVTTPGDVIISFDFTGAGPVVTVRVWVSPEALPGGSFAAFNLLADRPFNFTAIYDETSGATFGYAEIDAKVVSATPNVWAKVNTAVIGLASPFGTITTSGFDATVPLELLMEFSINLTAFGLDQPVTSGDPCANFFGALMTKTRTSPSFPSNLSDFAGPYIFGRQLAALYELETTPLTCTQNGTTTLTNMNPPFAGTTVTWSGAGLISGQGTQTATWNAGGKKYVDVLINGTECARRDSIIVESDLTPPTCSITGPGPVCSGTTNVYSTPADVPNYAWSVSANASIVGSSTDDNISVLAGNACGGSYTITLTLTNGTCSSTCSETYNIQSTTPSFTFVPSGATIQCPSTPSFGTPTASDACDSSPDITFEDDRTDGNCAQEYSITRTWTATNTCGNTAQVSRTIIVQDNAAPVLTDPGQDSTISCPGDPYQYFIPPTASDACIGSVTPDFDDETSPGSCPGVYLLTRTWTATDLCGNTSAPKSQTITVVDTTAPVIVGPGADETINCPDVPSFIPPRAFDGCDENPIVTLVSDETQPGACAGSYIQTQCWNATDCKGNLSVTVCQTITVVDNDDPQITGVGQDFAVECDDPSEFSSPSVSDNCDEEPSLDYDDETTPGNCPQEYSITRTWTARDACGNTSTASQTITVSDNTDPEINGVGETQNLNCGDAAEFSGPTASDNCDEEPSFTFDDETIPGNCPRNYSVVRTWTATDACGNSTTASQTINFGDNVGPVISGVGEAQTIECPATPQFSEPTASDACDPSPSLTFDDETTPGNCAQEYSITRTWSSTDDCGNPATTVSQTITVQDNTAPTIECAADETLPGQGADDKPCVDLGGGGVAAVSGLGNRAPKARVTVDFRQPRNQNHPGSPLYWTNGINNLHHTHYTEGMGVPQRIILSGLNGNNHTLKVRHEAVKHQADDIHAYDFLMSWEQAIATAGDLGGGVNHLQNLIAQACNSGISQSASVICSSLSSIPDLDARIAFAAPTDAMGNPPNHHGSGSVNAAITCFEAKYGDRTIEIRGDEAITAFSITFDGYSGSSSGDNYAHYSINWTSHSNEVMIKLAPRAASGGGCGYGKCYGASSINGGPYHFILDLIDGKSMGNRDNQAMVEPPPPCTVEIPVAFIPPTVADACDQYPTVEPVGTDQVSYNTAGDKIHCRTWRATDHCGNSSECSHCVTVTCNPIPTGKTDETGNADMQQFYDENMNLQASMKVYPNPFASSTLIQYTPTETSRVKIELMDVTGKLVKVMFDGNAEQNLPYVTELQAGSLANGMYVVRVSNADYSIKKQIVLQR